MTAQEVIDELREYAGTDIGPTARICLNRGADIIDALRQRNAALEILVRTLAKDETFDIDKALAANGGGDV